jgi:ATP-dependent Clp endopeptidase proteolytic subunit ClpP
MRDVPGLTPLLDRVAMRSEEPRFRFHGRRSPANRTRHAVLASAPSTAIVDGVATMRLYEPIDSWGGAWGISANEFLEALDAVSDAEEIRLHINSPGGEVWEALAILNNLRMHDARVVAQVDGIAASAASFIACAADETIMAPNTQLMIHDAWGLCVGNAADMHHTGDMLDGVSDNIADIYASKSGGTREEWRTTMRDEGWYLAAEAVDAGLADKVLGAEDADDSAEDPAAAFDLKGLGLKYAGRAEAPAPDQPTPAPKPDNSTEDDRRRRFQERRHAENARRAGSAA